ncbi:MAG: hypothetical protein VW339_11745, partial [Quisquiliibacterium sp.]
SGVCAADASGDGPVRDLFADRAAFDGWAVDYRARLAAESSDDQERRRAMNAVNPKYVLRNHLAEQAIRLARGDNEVSRLRESGQPDAPPGQATSAAGQDFGEVERLLSVLARPFDDQPEHEAYAQLPPDWAATLSVSCSS